MDKWQLIGLIGFVTAVIAILIHSVLFELDLTQHHGFGAFEVKVNPWLTLASVGLGFWLHSFGWALIFFVSMFIGHGMLKREIAQLIRKRVSKK
jgi:hypothetical protein